MPESSILAYYPEVWEVPYDTRVGVYPPQAWFTPPSFWRSGGLAGLPAVFLGGPDPIHRRY
jgi:hypothetical protein